MHRFGIALSLAALAAVGPALAETAVPEPWVRYVAPDRLCLRFGSFDWRGYMVATDAMAKRGQKEAAAKRYQALGEALWYLGRGTGRICSCTSQSATVLDLKRLVPELKRRPAIAHQEMAAAEHVEGTIAGIEAGGVAVVPPSHEGCKR